MTHSSNQTILEVLGARLAGDEIQEMSYDMQIENEVEPSQDDFGHRDIIMTGNVPNTETLPCPENIASVPNLEAFYYKKFFLNLETGRRNQTFCCQECDYSTTIKTNMRNHVRQHLGIKPYKCNHC